MRVREARFYIIGAIAGESAGPVILGLAVGASLAAVTLQAKPVQSLLFGVEVTDGATILSVAVTLLLIAIPALLSPALRAAAIDPLLVIVGPPDRQRAFQLLGVTHSLGRESLRYCAICVPVANHTPGLDFM